MGFIKVVNDDELDTDKILSYWNDAVVMERSPRICVDETPLENGKRILVKPLQMLVQIREKKVIDVITEAGGYIYHSDLENNKTSEQYAEVLNEYLEKDASVSQLMEIVYINLFSSGNVLNQIKEYIGSKEEKPKADMEIKFCGECGNKLPMPGIKFCPNCGTRL